MSSNSMPSFLLKYESETATIYGEKFSSGSKKTYESVEDATCGTNCYRMMCQNSKV